MMWFIVFVFLLLLNVCVSVDFKFYWFFDLFYIVRFWVVYVLRVDVWELVYVLNRDMMEVGV